ncbi:MAG: hypothetical protein HQ536_00115 [Parcubacteria group bacterium]|nr:hypothetical protein [Parcubacteria group bacterium]
MFTLQQVIEGLKSGQAYERVMESDGGKEFVTPAGQDDAGPKFRHNVSGMANGGWGGENVMHVNELIDLADRWKQDGWMLSI